MEEARIKSIIESLLLAVGDPMKIAKLAKVIGAKEVEIEAALLSLEEDYAKKRGFALLRIGAEVQLATNPENGEFVSKLIKGEMQESLSQASLEVLSIVAYRGPVSRAEIEAIRGVNCSFTLRSLLIRGLVEKTENSDDNRRYLYMISFDFLKKLGVDNVNKLPEWEALNGSGGKILETEVAEENSPQAAVVPEENPEEKASDNIDK